MLGLSRTWGVLCAVALFVVLRPTLAKHAPSCAATGGGADTAVLESVLVQMRASASRVEVASEDSDVDPTSPSAIQSGDSIYLRSHIGRFIAVMADGSVRADWNHRGEWEKLLVERADGAPGALLPGTAVFLTGWNSKRITVQGTAVHTKSDHQGERQKLTIERNGGEGPILEGDEVFFKGWAGNYIDVNYIDTMHYMDANVTSPIGGVQARWSNRRDCHGLTIERVLATGVEQ
mmetsp:Transcript_91755/g.237767  ORF Transcript_91755/g.237767 Transcript_91755/m.237767 type:complete len:234 (+) Transcript_91755:86-787(+)